MPGQIVQPRGPALPRQIFRRTIKRDAVDPQLADHVIGLGRAGPGADRHMRLAIFQPEHPRIGDVAQHQRRMRQHQIGHCGHHQPRQRGQRGDDQLPAHLLARAGDARGQLGKLILGRLPHGQKLRPRLGRRVAARMALEQLGAKPRLQRIDMADHGRMVHAQHLGRPRHGAHPRHLIGGAYLIPVFKPHCAPANSFAPIIPHICRYAMARCPLGRFCPSPAALAPRCVDSRGVLA